MIYLSAEIPLFIPSQLLYISKIFLQARTILCFETFGLIEQNGVNTWLQKDGPDSLHFFFKWESHLVLKVDQQTMAYESLVSQEYFKETI